MIPSRMRCHYTIDFFKNVVGWAGDAVFEIKGPQNSAAMVEAEERVGFQTLYKGPALFYISFFYISNYRNSTEICQYLQMNTDF